MNWIVEASGLTPSALAFAAAVTFVAAAIRGLTGFGMAIILVPLLGMVMRPEQAVVLGILLQFAIGPVGIRAILADAHRKSALLVVTCAMASTPLGLILLAHTTPDVARIAIAAIAVGAFLLVLVPRKGGGAPPSPALTVATGLASGVLTGFAAMPGPPVIPYYLRAGLSPQAARASMMLVFFGTAIAGTVAAVLGGIATQQLALLTLLLLVPMLAGNHIGHLGFGRISPPLWHGAVALLLGVASVSAVVRAL